jgi:hypothetical protein
MGGIVSANTNGFTHWQIQQSAINLVTVIQ